MNYYNTEIRIRVNEKEKLAFRLAAQKEGKGLSHFVRDTIKDKIQS